jgi:hypothetical protein
LLPLGLLAACVPTTSIDPATPPANAGGDECDAAPVQRFVGQRVTEALGAEVLATSGARSLRWGAPDSAMTMDYRIDRVNVFYDAGMIVERITCG